MVVRLKGRKWTLPDIVLFGNYEFLNKHYTYEVVDFRPPLKDEFYLSGAIPQAYQARNNLSTPFLIVVQKTRMILRQAWVPFDKPLEKVDA